MSALPDLHLDDPLAGPVRDVFDALNESAARYVVLRGFDPIEELAWSADIDVFIPARELERVGSLLNFSGWRHRRSQTGRLPHRFFDNWESDIALVRSLDVVTSLRYGKDSRYVLRNSEAVLSTSAMEHGVRVPSPWMAAFCFALHVTLDKGVVSLANARRGATMRQKCCAYPEGKALLLKNFGAVALEFVEDFFEVLAKDASNELPSLIARAVSLPCLVSDAMGPRLHAIRNRWRQLLRPVARVAVLGIDGSGKSTVVDKMSNGGGTVRVHSAYLGHNHYRTLPAQWLSRRLGAMRERGNTSGVTYRVFANLDALWQPFEQLARMMIAEHRAELVFYDRFPLGQDDGHPSTLWGKVLLAYKRFMRALLPGPDLVILLDGDDRTIWERKKEMPFDVHVRTQGGYRKLLEALSCSTAVVRSDDTLEETVSGVRAALRECQQVQSKIYGAMDSSELPSARNLST